MSRYFLFYYYIFEKYKIQLNLNIILFNKVLLKRNIY